MAKVLVVDDVPDNVKLLACELEDNGYEVFTASTDPRRSRGPRRRSRMSSCWTS